MYRSDGSKNTVFSPEKWCLRKVLLREVRALWRFDSVACTCRFLHNITTLFLSSRNSFPRLYYFLSHASNIKHQMNAINMDFSNAHCMIILSTASVSITKKQFVASSSRTRSGTGAQTLTRDHLEMSLDEFVILCFSPTWVMLRLRSMLSGSPTWPLRNLTWLVEMALFLSPNHFFHRGLWATVRRIRDLFSPSRPFAKGSHIL